MALTDFQRTICRLLAAHRIESGESYVAGGVALNELMATSRISRDIDPSTTPRKHWKRAGTLTDVSSRIAASRSVSRGNAARMWSPKGILEAAGRTARYSAEEVGRLAFAGDPPAPEALSRRWHAMLPAAAEIVDILPLANLGQCVLARDGTPFRGGARELQATVDRLIFHPGRIGGAWPELKQR